MPEVASNRPATMDLPLSDISIIIVNYNTLNLLRDCLTSVMQTEGRHCEVIVVDNASTDGSADMVEKEFPAVLVMGNQMNEGFSKANNQGMRQAKGKYFLMLNSDTIVRAGAVAAMAEFLGSHAAAGAVTCKLMNADGTIQASISNRPGPMLLFFRLLGVSRIVSGDRARRWLFRGGSVFRKDNTFLPYSLHHTRLSRRGRKHFRRLPDAAPGSSRAGGLSR